MHAHLSNILTSMACTHCCKCAVVQKNSVLVFSKAYAHTVSMKLDTETNDAPGAASEPGYDAPSIVSTW